MTKTLFFNVPGHGHVNPSLPLVAELVRRGHEIIYFVTDGYQQNVEATGAKFRAYASIPDDYFTARGLSGSVPQKVAHALITTTEAILPELLEIARAENPDYILFDGMCPWGGVVGRILNLPVVASLALAPLVTPPPKAALPMLRIILPMIFKDFGKGLEANRRANALTTKYHLPPFGMTGIMNNVGDLSISYTSEYFQPFANTVDKSVRFVGWTLNENPASSDFSFDRVQGRPLIYISLGTLNNDDRSFFEACIEAFKGNDSFVIISTGSNLDPQSFGTLPENVAIYKWVPQVEVLKRASLFISHGGMNSVHDSLYLGVPLLLVPQQPEQTLNSMRVVELGAGLMLKQNQIDAQKLRDTAKQLLTNPNFKTQAKHIGNTFREAGGAVRGADEIEQFLRK
jgi:MGT family glycosyltransferase